MGLPMKRILSLLAVLALASPAAARAQAPTAADSAGIRAAALDYVQGWYDGNADRMRRALHPELVKRIVSADSAGNSRIDQMGADRLVEMTGRRSGSFTPAGGRVEDVRILDIFGNAAAVRAEMAGWIDYMQMGKVNGRWVIVNVLWVLKPRS